MEKRGASESARQKVVLSVGSEVDRPPPDIIPFIQVVDNLPNKFRWQGNWRVTHVCEFPIVAWASERNMGA
jgi:hypothetical protein